uniref:Uncharacterized protein n=1 Tax=Mycena chlorophos TaxID=658473 RepID=A0ABQ0LQU2_MYCCL|nr:predicted protein [Mycena chlorophos]
MGILSLLSLQIPLCQVGRAIKRIWNLCLKRRGISLCYEDNFTAFLFVLLNGFGWEFICIIADLRIEWGWDKSGMSVTARFDSLGFSWDIPAKTVALMENKRVKYLARVDKILDANMIMLHDLQIVHGTLSYTTFVYRDGSSYLLAISNAFSTKKRRITFLQ